MQISRKDWDNYIKRLSKVNTEAAKLVKEYIEKNGVEDVQALVNYSYRVAAKYGNASASLAAMMYDVVADLEGIVLDPAELASLPKYGEVAKAVQGTLKTSQNPEEIAGAVSRLVKRTGQDTILQNAERDRAQFAWIPSGDTCAFCITLASRGWQNMSKKALSGGHAEHIHSNCDCTYMIRHSEDFNVAGYNPQEYADMYYGAEGNTPKEKINAMRRKFYAENKSIVGAESDKAEEFIPKAKNRQDAYNILNGMFGSISDNVKSLNEELLVENINRLNELNLRFKAIDADNKGYFTASPSGRAMAWTSTNYEQGIQNTRLSLVGKWFKNTDVLVKQEEQAQKVFFSMPFNKSYIKTYTITHEYGHVLEAHISKKRTDWTVINSKVAKMVQPSHSQIRNVYIAEEKAQAKNIYEEIVGIAKKNNSSFSLKDNLSKYGHTNHFEFFAEVFANSQCGSPNELGQAMNEWLKKEGF